MKKNLFILSILILVNNLFAEKFHFAILGDRASRPNQKAYEMVVNDIERLKPDFVMTIGDISDDGKLNEWDLGLKPLEKISSKIYFVPGNNDIIDEVTYKRFIEKTKFNPYYSFDYMNTHFIVLDNSIAENYNEMSDEQKIWLKKDLEINKNKQNIYVFMHKPFWSDGIAAGKDDSLHFLFKKNNVDAVFTGHWHQTAYKNIDGIEYFLVGSSGGGFGNNNKENIDLGLFYQFFWCTVEDGKLNVAVIKAGNIFDKDIVSIEEQNLTYEIESKLISSNGVIKNSGKEKIAEVNISIINKTNEKINNEIKFNIPSNWILTKNDNKVDINENSTFIKTFTFINKGSFYPLPKMIFKYPLGKNKFYEYTAPLNIVRTIQAIKFNDKIEFDGCLNDKIWRNVKFEDDFVDFDGNKSKTDGTKIAFIYDERNLYFAAICEIKDIDKNLISNATERDGQVYNDDCLGFLFGLNSEEIIQFYVNPNGTIWDAKINTNNSESNEKWNGNFDIRTSKDNNKWIIEGKIPLELLNIDKNKKEIKINIRRKQQYNKTNDLFSLAWNIQQEKYGILQFK